MRRRWPCGGKRRLPVSRLCSGRLLEAYQPPLCWLSTCAAHLYIGKIICLVSLHSIPPVRRRWRCACASEDTLIAMRVGHRVQAKSGVA